MVRFETTTVPVAIKPHTSNINCPSYANFKDVVSATLKHTLCFDDKDTNIRAH